MGQREGGCSVSFNNFPFRIVPCRSTHTLYLQLSDSFRTLSASDSAQPWFSSSPARYTVAALPQLPRRAQTVQMCLVQPQMTLRFISKLDTHTRIKDSPATNTASASLGLCWSQDECAIPLELINYFAFRHIGHIYIHCVDS